MLSDQPYLGQPRAIATKPLSIGPLSAPISPQNSNMPINLPIHYSNLNQQNVIAGQQQRIISKPSTVTIYPALLISTNNSNTQPNLSLQGIQNISANTIITGNLNNVLPSSPNTPTNNTRTVISQQPANIQTSQLYRRITNEPNKILSRPSYLFFGSQSASSNSRSVSPIVEPSRQIHHQTTGAVQSHSQQARTSNNSRVNFNYQNNMHLPNTIVYEQRRVIHQQQPYNQINTIAQPMPIRPIVMPGPQVTPIMPPPQNSIQHHNYMQSQNQNFGLAPLVPTVPSNQVALPNNQIAVPNNQIVNVVTTTTIIWQHRFVQIYSKFEIFVQKFQTIVQEIYYIDDLFDNVNDEEAWNDLRVKYTQVIDRFNEMREEIILVLEQNKAAINSLSPEVVRELQQRQQQYQQPQQQPHQGREHEEAEENQQGGQQGGMTGKSQGEHVWENRCLELMQQHEQLTQQNMSLKNQIERVKLEYQQNKGGAQRKPRQSQRDGNKVIEMQRNLNTFHMEYQKLEQNYSKLSQEYSRVVAQLQSEGRQDVPADVNQLQQQLQMADAKIQELYEDIQKKNEHITELDKQIQSGGQILQQNKTLIETINKLHKDLEFYGSELKNKDDMLVQYDNQVKNLHEQMVQMSQALEQFQNHSEPQSNKNNQQVQRKSLQIQSLREKQKSLLNLIEKHEQSIQQMAIKNQTLTIDFQALTKNKQEQIKMFQNLLQQQRQAKQRALSQALPISTQKHQSIGQTAIFRERVQIEVEQIVADKDRKIKSLTQDINDIKLQLEALEKQKNKSIKQIKDYFAEQQQKYVKQIQEKVNNLKLLNEKIKSFENELSNRNLEISRFRAQSPVNSFGSSNDQTKRYNEAIERKNNQMKQLRMSYEKKVLQNKELQQKLFGLQQELNSKIFQMNNLKREIFDSHGRGLEVDNLNNIIKKKNQQINELRLSSMQIQQLKLSLDSLQRQKIRLSEYLKEKTRQCESKDNTIQSLERKVSSFSFEAIGVTSRRTTGDDRNTNTIAVNNYENLLRQKDTEIKNLRYELEMIQTKVDISEKTIRDLNTKISNIQKSSALVRAQMQNKLSKYETQIKQLNKQIRNLKANKQQLTNIVESLQTKNSSLSKSLDERNTIFDSELRSYKSKVTQIEKQNTLLLVDQQVLKAESERMHRQNKDLNQKINSLRQKIEQKNKAIGSIKTNNENKQKDYLKIYEQKIKKLDNELKFSYVKIKNMEQQISKLNKKIVSAESQKRSYKQRLITEHSNDKQQLIDFRHVSQHYDYGAHQILQMDRFKLKDPEANDVFERKVIYDLKRQNDLLRRQLSGAGIGLNSYSMNRIETENNRFSSYHQQVYTDRDHVPVKEDNYAHNQILSYHKSKNKELEDRVDELIRVNTQLNERLKNLNINPSNVASIQFYKQQVSKLEAQVSKLQAKIKQLLSQHNNYRDEITGHQHEGESLRNKINDLNSTIAELRNTIKNRDQTVVQLENARQICLAQIERLKQVSSRKDKYKQSATQMERNLTEMTKKLKGYQQQIAKLTNKTKIQGQQIERLNEIIKNKKTELESKFQLSGEETKKLKKRILQLQKQLQILKLQRSQNTTSSLQLAFKIEKIRSFFIEIDALVGEIPLFNSRAQQVGKHIRLQIQEGLQTISIIQV